MPKNYYCQNELEHNDREAKEGAAEPAHRGRPSGRRAGLLLVWCEAWRHAWRQPRWRFQEGGRLRRAP